MTTPSNAIRHISLIAAVIVLLGFSSASAQSGRRGAKITPPPVPVPTPESTTAPVAEKSKVAIRFILGMDQHESFSSVSLGTAASVRRSCAGRLDEPEWAKVESSQRTMSRSDAIKLAKGEKDGYVVFLRLREDTMSSRTTGTPNNAYIEYTVFAPGTAKVFTSGSTYPSRGRGVVVDPRTTGMEGDYYLNRAARETADRILSKFSIPINNLGYSRFADVTGETSVP